jgi:3',5'-cyclic AMP phosphodiesterase CpdA
MKVPSDLVVFPSKTIRIVCISDTHGEDPSPRIPPGDILIHAGDLTDPGSLLELERAYQWISKLSHPVKVVVAGKMHYYVPS